MKACVSSWQVMEGSREAGGLPGVFLLKSLILVMPVLMVLQTLAGLLRDLLVIRGIVVPESETAEVEV